ncbi:MAG: hypothetical protein JNM70_05755 [Anaerolineae bacterium]|nr:hypothetical protein [Anaerolineae bacterium]
MNRKLIWTSLIVFALVWSFALSAVGAQDNTTAPTLSISADAEQAVVGQTVSLTVNVSGAMNVYGTSFKIAYDPSAFEVVATDGKAVTPGAFFANEPGFALRNIADAGQGVIEYALTLMQPAKPVTGDGILGTVTLRALKDTPVAISVTQASFVSPEFTEVNGQLVAQKVNQIAAQVETSPVTVASASASASAGQVSSPVNAADPNQVAMFNNPALKASPQAEHGHDAAAATDTTFSLRNDSVMMASAIVFFFVGIILLTVSVGMYSRMRTRLALPSDYALAGEYQ